MQLDKNKIHHLKTLAHSRKPVIMIGQKGLTENVIKETSIALEHHELIKIKVNVGDREQRKTIISSLCEQTGSDCIQQIGNIAVIFLRHHKHPVVVFPE